MEKLQMNIYQAMPVILEMVKMESISRETEHESSWFHNKMRNDPSKGGGFQFLPRDVKLVNGIIYNIANVLKDKLIKYDVDRDKVIDQVLDVAEIIRMPYIWQKMLGKKKHWYTNRIKRAIPGFASTSFSEKDINLINMEIFAIANKLLAIEMTL